MIINDFCYLWRGYEMMPLDSLQAHLIAPLDKRGVGNERALLLLHGFSSTPAVFRRLLPALTQYDAIVCPALPGHGDSIASFSLVKAKEWLFLAERDTEALIKDYRQVDVLGLSLGGLLACHVSQRFKLHHLYLLAPALALKLPIKLTLALAHVLGRLGLRSLRNRGGNLNSKQYPELAYRQLPITSIIEVLTLIDEFQLTGPNCPTDLFLGRADAVVDSTRVEQYFFKRPNVNIHWLENSAHVLPLDADVESIIACIGHNS